MKAYKKTTAILVTGIFLMASCVGDLDPKPLGSQAVTSAALYKTPPDFLQGLAKLYASFILQGSNGDTDITTTLTGGDGGATVYTRKYWEYQELSTDEAVIAWTGNADQQNIHQQNWTPTGGYITCLYTRMLFTVTLCNEFIRVSNGNSNAAIQQYNAEARFLRALAYWHLLDLFGNPPFITDSSPIGTLPHQITSPELYKWLVAELNDIENKLGAPGFSYGHADQGALWMLQAKLFLNAKTYHTTSGPYDSCITALNKIFTSTKYSLATHYLDNFCADNNLSPEIIFPITEDGISSQTYGGMNFVIHAAIGGNMSASSFGIDGGWAGTRVTSALVSKFADPSGATDVRAQFFTNGQTLDIADYTKFSDGYAVSKFTNKTHDGLAAKSGGSAFVDTDYPMFRLADAYLMYAEATLRGASTGNATTALGYVNQVLTRAYNGSNSGNISSGTLSLSWILDERARELYWEGHRRTDLIRFQQFTDGTYVWPWKGNVLAGTQTDAHFNLLPIPASDMSVNPNLQQNYGYPKQ